MKPQVKIQEHVSRPAQDTNLARGKKFIRPFFCEDTVENISYAEIANRFGTPIFITVLDSVSERVEAYKKALRKHFLQGDVHYAMKANAAPPILGSVLRAGGCVEVVSAREAQHALAAGFSPHHICFAGVGKTHKEITWALQNQLKQLNCEHVSELNYVLETIQKMELETGIVCHTLVGLRLNPCLEVNTHPHLLTGALSSKFGVLANQFHEYLVEAKKTHGSNFDLFTKPLKALHVHVGSQLQAQEFFPKVVEQLLESVVFCAHLGVQISTLDLGGGLIVGSNGWNEKHSDIFETIEYQCATFKKLCKAHKNWKDIFAAGWGESFEELQVVLEPGRSLVASSTVLLSQVLYTKRNTQNNLIAICDAGMNDFPRPAIYGAKHEVFKVTSFQDAPQLEIQSKTQTALSKHIKTTLSGPVCESACKLAEIDSFPEVSVGDFVCLLEAGAYCASMGSHYNQRSLPAQVFFEHGKLKAHIERKEAEIPKVELL